MDIDCYIMVGFKGIFSRMYKSRWSRKESIFLGLRRSFKGYE